MAPPPAGTAVPSRSLSIHSQSQNTPPSFSSSSQFLFLNLSIHHINYPSGHSEPAVPAVSGPSLLPTLSLAVGYSGSRGGLDTVQAQLSNSQNIGVLSALL